MNRPNPTLASGNDVLGRHADVEATRKRRTRTISSKCVRENAHPQNQSNRNGKESESYEVSTGGERRTQMRNMRTHRADTSANDESEPTIVTRGHERRE